MSASPDTPPAADGDAGPAPLLLPVPDLDVRWVHAGAQHLNLLPTPITAPSTSYKAFSSLEFERIEEKWESMNQDERKSAVDEWGSLDGEGAPAKARRANKAKGTKESKDSKDSKDSRVKRTKSPMGKEALRVGEVDDIVEPEPNKAQEEILSGPEQAGDGDSKYKEIIRAIQKDADPDNIQGVPVSQVRSHQVVQAC